MATTVSAAAFAAFLKARLAAHDGYIMCATGQDPKTLSDWWFSGQYSGSQLTKARYWRDHADRVWDCNGLAEGYYKDMTGTDINTRARNNYSEWCSPKGTGTIPAAYRVPGAAVFKKSSYIHHVGYLVEPVNAGNPAGDWYIIEAKGVMYGVVRTKLSAGGWNCWGLMTKYYDYDAAAVPDNHEYTLGERLLTRGCTGDDVEQLQKTMQQIGLALPKYGADGDYGEETQAAVEKMQQLLRVDIDGEYGEITHAALMAYIERDTDEDPAPVDCFKVEITADLSANVRSGPGTDSSIITIVRRGQVFDGVTQASNGWYQIKINGGLGWVSGRMARRAA